ncbi:MAG TPA: radical SAM protein, partial [Thermoanaerobaculia bacterium]|nr:radical SAM protein [Thermoanaerobaculia bacterium]
NKITEYRKMLLAWKSARIITYAGYILGFPNDSIESIRRDIEIIKKELPVDLLEFFFLTPLPGSEDHQVLHKQGVPMDPDMNKYDLNHVTAPHPKMSQDEWERAYRMAWETYYTPEHVEAVLRRNVKMRCSASNAILLMTWFGGSIHIEGVHPLEAGFFRKKFRRDRRSGFAIEPRWKFYPSYVAETFSKLWRWGSLYAGLRRKYVRIKRDPQRLEYMDVALTPVTDHDLEDLELFHTTAAESYVAREHRVEQAREGALVSQAT